MRKLGRNDRIVGAMLLAAEHGLPFDAIAAVYCAALSFKATNEEGQMDKKDAQFHKLLENQGIEGVLRDVSGLGNTEYDRNVFETVRETCSKAKKERREKI
jgi:mannitol-1-phosphate/altronate dehydrogenase